MKIEIPSFLGNILRLFRPWTILTSIFMYLLGGGVAHYLGQPINWATFSAGLGCMAMLISGSNFLKSFFDLLPPQQSTVHNSGVNDLILFRRILLQLSVTILTLWAVLSLLILSNGENSILTTIILCTGFFLAFFYGVPPMRFANSGFGELSEAILITNISPALAFIIQTGELHRLLAMLTFPLTAIYLAMRLAQSLEHYYDYMKSGEKNLIIRLGWQRGMTFHNLMILTAYLLLVVAVSLGLPWVLAWPGLLSLPFGLFQIWMILQINDGIKPRWKLLNLTAVSTFFLTTYLVSFALWTR